MILHGTKTDENKKLKGKKGFFETQTFRAKPFISGYQRFWSTVVGFRVVYRDLLFHYHVSLPYKDKRTGKI